MPVIPWFSRHAGGLQALINDAVPKIKAWKLGIWHPSTGLRWSNFSTSYKWTRWGPLIDHTFHPLGCKKFEIDKIDSTLWCWLKWKWVIVTWIWSTQLTKNGQKSQFSTHWWLWWGFLSTPLLFQRPTPGCISRPSPLWGCYLSLPAAALEKEQNSRRPCTE